MTHDPRLPTLEEIMNGNPFELVDSPWGHIEAWRASTLATGTMGALAQVYDTVRNDAATTAERVAALDATRAQLQTLCDMIDNLHKRMDQHAARLETFEAKRRADEQQQREFEEEPLALPPEPDDPVTGDETHQPSGDLHSIAAKSEELEGEEPAPSLELETDAGGVPLSYGNVPLSYVRGGPKEGPDPPEAFEDQVEFAIPEPQMTIDARRRRPKGKVVPQPIAVSLNKE